MLPVMDAPSPLASGTPEIGDYQSDPRHAAGTRDRHSAWPLSFAEALPQIFVRPLNTLSPSIMCNIGDLALDWCHLDKRIEAISKGNRVAGLESAKRDDCSRHYRFT